MEQFKIVVDFAHFLDLQQLVELCKKEGAGPEIK